MYAACASIRKIRATALLRLLLQPHFAQFLTQEDRDVSIDGKIELLCGIPIFHTEDEKSAPESVGAFLEQESPFACAPPLVEMLVKRCESQALPVVYKDEYGAFFICVKGKSGFYLAGPVCTEDMDYAGLNRFYEAYGIAGEEKKHPVKTVLFRILTYAAVISELENEAALDCQEILKENGLAEEMEAEEKP